MPLGLRRALVGFLRGSFTSRVDSSPSPTRTGREEGREGRGGRLLCNVDQQHRHRRRRHSREASLQEQLLLQKEKAQRQKERQQQQVAKRAKNTGQRQQRLSSSEPRGGGGGGGDVGGGGCGGGGGGSGGGGGGRRGLCSWARSEAERQDAAGDGSRRCTARYVEHRRRAHGRRKRPPTQEEEVEEEEEEDQQEEDEEEEEREEEEEERMRREDADDMAQHSRRASTRHHHRHRRSQRASQHDRRCPRTNHRRRSLSSASEDMPSPSRTPHSSVRGSILLCGQGERRSQRAEAKQEKQRKEKKKKKKDKKEKEKERAAWREARVCAGGGISVATQRVHTLPNRQRLHREESRCQREHHVPCLRPVASAPAAAAPCGQLLRQDASRRARHRTGKAETTRENNRSRRRPSGMRPQGFAMDLLRAAGRALDSEAHARHVASASTGVDTGASPPPGHPPTRASQQRKSTSPTTLKSPTRRCGRRKTEEAPLDRAIGSKGVSHCLSPAAVTPLPPPLPPPPPPPQPPAQPQPPPPPPPPTPPTPPPLSPSLMTPPLLVLRSCRLASPPPLPSPPAPLSPPASPSRTLPPVTTTEMKKFESSTDFRPEVQSPPSPVLLLRSTTIKYPHSSNNGSSKSSSKKTEEVRTESPVFESSGLTSGPPSNSESSKSSSPENLKRLALSPVEPSVLILQSACLSSPHRSITPTEKITENSPRISTKGREKPSVAISPTMLMETTKLPSPCSPRVPSSQSSARFSPAAHGESSSPASFAACSSRKEQPSSRSSTHRGQSLNSSEEKSRKSILPTTISSAFAPKLTRLPSSGSGKSSKTSLSTKSKRSALSATASPVQSLKSQSSTGSEKLLPRLEDLPCADPSGGDARRSQSPPTLDSISFARPSNSANSNKYRKDDLYVVEDLEFSSSYIVPAAVPDPTPVPPVVLQTAHHPTPSNSAPKYPEPPETYPSYNSYSQYPAYGYNSSYNDCPRYVAPQEYGYNQPYVYNQPYAYNQHYGYPQCYTDTQRYAAHRGTEMKYREAEGTYGTTYRGENYPTYTEVQKFNEVVMTPNEPMGTEVASFNESTINIDLPAKDGSIRNTAGVTSPSNNRQSPCLEEVPMETDPLPLSDKERSKLVVETLKFNAFAKHTETRKDGGQKRETKLSLDDFDSTDEAEELSIGVVRPKATIVKDGGGGGGDGLMNTLLGAGGRSAQRISEESGCSWDEMTSEDNEGSETSSEEFLIREDNLSIAAGTNFSRELGRTRIANRRTETIRSVKRGI